MDKFFRTFSSFDRQDRVGKFSDQFADEAILDQINLSLTSAEEMVAQRFKGGPVHGSTLIVGMPRSGTTYLYQKLAATLDIGYVSNLMARFYGAPMLGAWLQTRLIGDEIRRLCKFESSHGVTSAIYEPHEFGYFWSSYLQFPGDCHEPGIGSLDGERLALMGEKLDSISVVFGKPVVYKCMIAPFMLGDILRKTSVRILYVNRLKEEVLASVLRVREERLGSREKWWSIRPAGWQAKMALPPQEQVAWQYDRVTEAMEAACAEYPERFCRVDYADLVAHPDIVCERIERFIKKEVGELT